MALVTAAPDNIHSEQQRHVAVLHPGIIELVTDYSRVHASSPPLLVIALVSARHHRVARVAGGDVHLSFTHRGQKQAISQRSHFDCLTVFCNGWYAPPLS